MEADNRTVHITRLFEQLRSIRAKGDKLRWMAMAFINHRTKESAFGDDCPVPDIHLYDCTGILAVRTFVEGLGSSIMSPGQEWFSMRLMPIDFETELPPAYGVRYLTYAKKKLAYEMDHSNFYDEETIGLYDAISCGYSCTMFQNDSETGSLYLKTLAPWNCYFDTDKAGNYCCFMYTYTLDGQGLIDEFGKDGNIPEKILNEAKISGKERRYSILYCIAKRPYVRDSEGNSIRYSKKISKRMKYAAIYILRSDGDYVLRESGFVNFPVVIHVWEKSGDSQYGIGLVMKYIAEFGKLNRLAYEYGLSVAKLNHGAWLVPDTMTEAFSDDPETIIPYQSKDLLPMQLQEKIDVNAAGEQLMLQQQYIQKLFYNDIFSYLLNQDKVFTATQVNAVKAEGLGKIYPIYTRLQKQKIDPSLSLVYSIMLSNRRIRKPSAKLMVSKDRNRIEFILDSAMSQMLANYQAQTSNSVLLDLAIQLINLGLGDLVERYMNVGNLILSYMEQTGADSNLYVSPADRQTMENNARELSNESLDLERRLKESEINRNNAGAANLNNAIGANGGFS